MDDFWESADFAAFMTLMQEQQAQVENYNSVRLCEKSITPNGDGGYITSRRAE